MMEGYTYILWHPHVYMSSDERSFIQCNLTPGESTMLKEPCVEFVQQILGDLHVEAEAIGWQNLTYRSTYQGDADSTSWEDRWPVNWRLRIALKKPLTQLPSYSHEFVGTTAQKPEVSLGFGDPAEPLPCLVICDYRDQESAERVHNSLRGSLLTEQLTYHMFQIGRGLFQQQIEFSQMNASDFADGNPALASVVDTCRAFGGLTSFDKRVFDWGEKHDLNE
jgi:hypothetical protein